MSHFPPYFDSGVSNVNVVRDSQLSQSSDLTQYTPYSQQISNSQATPPLLPLSQRSTGQQISSQQISSQRKSPPDDDEDDTNAAGGAPGAGANKRFRSEGFLGSSQVIPISPFFGLRRFMNNTQTYHHALNQMDSDNTGRLCPLKAWNLPERLLEYYYAKNIEELFPWQLECLRKGDVLFKGRNLVYSAPTSAGKSMVADMLMYKTLFERKKKAMVILPFVSIALEKVQSLKMVLRSVGIAIESFAGSARPPGGLARTDVAVCTIEKANNMINRLIQEDKLSEFGIIIIDELHMLADPSRGYLLELLISKLLFSSQSKSLSSKPKVNPLQIVGMSATIPNLPSIATWLDAELYTTDFRPVPLYQRIVRGSQLFEVPEKIDMSVIDSQNPEMPSQMKPIESPVDLEGLSITTDDGPLIYYAIETIEQGFSALVFCPTKLGCEKMARSIAENIFEFGGRKKIGTATERISQIGDRMRSEINQPKIRQLLTALRQTAVNLDKSLASSVRFGVGFHHAGLSMEERGLVERAFRDGTIRVLCATTTLSAGVNLPARRVLIYSPFDYRGHVMNVSTYRQMIGRAGRAGIDTLGESMLFCKDSSDFASGLLGLVGAQLPPIKSCLIQENGTGSSDPSESSTQSSTQSSFMAASQYSQKSQVPDKETLLDMSDCLKRALLEVIANGTASIVGDISAYMDCTFFQSASSQANAENEPPFDPYDLSSMLPLSRGNVFTPDIEEAIKEVVDYLTTNQILLPATEEGQLKVSTLGSAIVASGVSPDDGQFIQRDLKKARDNAYLTETLHMIYQVTPPYIADNLDLDWAHYMQIWLKLSEKERTVGEQVGASERYIHKKMSSLQMGAPKKNTPAHDALLVHQRFYASLALYELVQERPLPKVADKYKINKGHIQSLQQQSATFAGMLTAFCERLGEEWSSMATQIRAFQPRLSFGVQVDLVDLMRVNCLTSITARQLYSKGLQSLAKLAACSIGDIEEALISMESFIERSSGGSSQSQSSSPEVTSSPVNASTEVFVPPLGTFLTIHNLANRIHDEATTVLEMEKRVMLEDAFQVKEEQKKQEAESGQEPEAP